MGFQTSLVFFHTRFALHVAILDWAFFMRYRIDGFIPKTVLRCQLESCAVHIKNFSGWKH